MGHASFQVVLAAFQALADLVVDHRGQVQVCHLPLADQAAHHQILAVHHQVLADQAYQADLAQAPVGLLTHSISSRCNSILKKYGSNI